MPIEKVERVEITKFCKDCFWARNKYSILSQWICKSPHNVTYKDNGSIIFSKVSGEPEPIYPDCLSLRQESAFCGREGAWFLSHQEYNKQLAQQHHITALTGRPSSVKVSDI